MRIGSLFSGYGACGNGVVPTQAAAAVADMVTAFQAEQEAA